MDIFKILHRPNQENWPDCHFNLASGPPKGGVGSEVGKLDSTVEEYRHPGILGRDPST